jgi:curved DNA-binding protein CbpA
MPRQPNYYRILDVPLAADKAQIQHAYRVLAKRYHPDLVPPERREWARAQMARINAAYAVLSDPARRATYDYRQGYGGRGSPRPAVRRPTTTRARRSSLPDRALRHKTVRHSPVRRERWRRERMSRQRVRLLGSALTLGALVTGALYWWRELSPGLPLQRWTWAILLGFGLLLVLLALGRTIR